MSFSSETKAELCRENIERPCCAVAEACGVLLFGNAFAPDRIRISTVSPEFAERLPRLFKKAFGFGFDSEPKPTDKRSVFTITDTKKLDTVFDICGGDRGRFLSHHVNLALVEEEHDRQSFVRGAFLAGGSVNEPQKRYHLELVTHHYSVSRETVALLRDMGFDPGETAREGNFLVYFKNSAAIEDLLTTIGAPVSAMGLMSAKIEKSIAGVVNRRMNCDGANIDKTVDAAERQLAAIRRLREMGVIDELGDKLKYTAMMREDNPELSLAQLAGLFSPPVSKSSLSYRLRRLCALAGMEEEEE